MKVKVNVLLIIGVHFFVLLLLQEASWAFRMWLLKQIFILLPNSINLKHVLNITFLGGFIRKWNTALFTLGLNLLTNFSALCIGKWLFWTIFQSWIILLCKFVLLDWWYHGYWSCGSRGAIHSFYSGSWNYICRGVKITIYLFQLVIQ
jgi:hypothetical protein